MLVIYDHFCLASDVQRPLRCRRKVRGAQVQETFPISSGNVFMPARACGTVSLSFFRLRSLDFAAGNAPQLCALTRNELLCNRSYGASSAL
jgi:hypothetical protein